MKTLYYYLFPGRLEYKLEHCLSEKKDLYFAAKAEEVWLCDGEGRIRFYNQQGELKQSFLVPDFPKQIERRKQH